MTLRWQAAHDEGGLAAYQVYLDGRLVRVARAAGGPPATVARVRVRAGRHRWRVVAIDRAGNRRASGNGSFKV